MWVRKMNQPPDEASPNRLGVALAANACMFMFGAILLLMGSLLPSLQVNYQQAGSLGSLPLAGVWIATVFVGPFLDLRGAKPALVLALLLTASSLGVMSYVHSYGSLAASAFVYGLGGGLLNTTTNALISQLHDAGRASALNLLGFSFSLGALAAPLLMSAAGGLAPATAVRLLAIVSGLILIPVLVLRFPAASRAGVPPQVLLRTLKRPLVWAAGLLLLFESGSENCMFVWSSKILAETLRVTAERANLGLVGLAAAIGAGRLWAAFLTRHLGSRLILMASAAIAAVGAATVALTSNFAGMAVGMILTGLGMSAIFPTALAVTGDNFPRETGTVFGAVTMVALVGGAAGPKLAGVLASHGALQVLWIPLVAAAAIFALSPIVAAQAGKPAASSD
ncbi:MAG TPA: MFS transporter [Terriglobia bacterium]|nr:MFS transporter [Terriglobia bacterium]